MTTKSEDTETIEKGSAGADALLRLMRKRFSAGVEADRHNRRSAKEDMEFAYVPGSQWDSVRKAEHQAEGRPTLEINRMPTFLAQVIGDQRQAKPSIKIHPVDAKGDPEVAIVLEGLVRNIEAVSNADIAYDTAFEHTTGGGFGYWRIITDYCDDNSFDQEIQIKAITNSFSVVWDPVAVEWDMSDAGWVIVHSLIQKTEYERLYPNKLPANFEESDTTHQEWVLEDAVRIAEYFYKKPKKNTIYLLESGEVVDEVPEGETAKDSRAIDGYEIYRVKVDGYNILEEEQLWPSKYWPIVPVIGKSIYIDGKRYVWGLIHYSKDSQRAYNVTRSRETEMYMLAPLAPVVATAKQIGPYKPMWDNANKKTYPYLLYQTDPEAQGPPQRLNPPQISSALANSAARDIDDIKGTMGLFDASLGNRSNETSGVAIKARQMEGDVGTFPFIDNLARARNLTYRVLVDLIPKIYDAKRIIRVLGIDGTVKTVEINAPGQVEDESGIAIDKILNDLTVGKYDITMTMGPSYSTQRMEAADSLMRFVQSAPQVASLIGDLIAKNQDWPGAQEVARRLRTIVPPAALSREEREEMAKDAPQQPQGPPAPDPKLIELQTKLQMDAERLKMEMDLHEYTKAKMEAEIENIRATGMKNIAQAEALEAGQQFEQYKLELGQLSQNIAHHVALTLEEMRQGRQQGSQAPPGGNGQGAAGEVMGNEPGVPGEGQGTPGMPANYVTNPGQMAPPPAMGEQQNMPGTIPGVEGRAVGGPVNPNQPYLVGEQGPEVIVPDHFGEVIPNPNTVTGLPADYITEILNQNADKNFVQRIMKPDLYPNLPLGEGSYGTHLMSHDPKEGIVFPTIVQRGEQLVRLSPDEAYDYAKSTGEFIKFKNPADAEYFAKNYKSVWGNP